MTNAERYGYTKSETGLPCECGCGETTKPYRGYAYRFVRGHQLRGKAPKYTVDPVTGCWNWNGYKDHGYGIVRVGRKTKKAHRVYWEAKNGPIPTGLYIDHLCRNHSCVNPDHLEPVTPAVNKRRGNRVILNEQLVREIRRLANQGLKPTAIAKLIGSTTSAVSLVTLGHNWRDIYHESI